MGTESPAAGGEDTKPVVKNKNKPKNATTTIAVTIILSGRRSSKGLIPTFVGMSSRPSAVDLTKWPTSKLSMS